jgi:serine/threonine protein phosphatase PrpC
MLTVCARTHPGSVRRTNEDVALWDPVLGLLVVADGMGGHNAGEVASRLAVDAVRSFLGQSVEDGDHWPFGVDRTLSQSANRLKTAVRIANVRVHRAAEERAEYGGMGTTIAAALVNGSQLTYTSVGDSRIYTWGGAELRQLTADDSWIAVLQRESGLGAHDFDRHPMRHVLTSVIGARREVDVSVHELTLTDGQTLVLCSDGLHGAVPDSMIASTLKEQPDLERAAATLVETAVARDGSDNVTIVLARHSGRM